MSLKPYHVDCSKLSIEEYREIYKFFDMHSFFLSDCSNQVRSFIAYWETKNVTPFDLREFPHACLINEI